MRRKMNRMKKGAARRGGLPEELKGILTMSSHAPMLLTDIALYFKAVKGVDWRDIDPRMLMSADFSSASGWQENVARELQSRGLLPQQGGSNRSV